MNNRLIVAGAQFFQSLGCGTIRINFRGWGISNGSSEKEQLKSCLKYLKDKQLGFKRVLVVAYSHGSMISHMLLEGCEPGELAELGVAGLAR
jgi:alpha/beta superfamily hydrolase